MTEFPIEEYRKQINGFYKTVAGYEAVADICTGGRTWTIRNHIAHLVDSASNNHQRFIRLQLETAAIFPGYEAEPWVEAAGIRRMSFLQLLDLWKLYNEYLLEIISAIQPDCLAHVWKPDKNSSPVTLSFLVADYFSHLKLHADMIDAIARDAGAC